MHLATAREGFWRNPSGSSLARVGEGMLASPDLGSVLPLRAMQASPPHVLSTPAPTRLEASEDAAHGYAYKTYP